MMCRLSWRGLVATSCRLSAVITSHHSRFRGYSSIGHCFFLSMYIEYSDIGSLSWLVRMDVISSVAVPWGVIVTSISLNLCASEPRSCRDTGRYRDSFVVEGVVGARTMLLLGPLIPRDS